MMGAGIAYVCAKAGIEVVLKDVYAGGRRARQGLLGEARRQGRRARQDHAGEGRRAARADHADRRPGGRRGRRPRDRGGVRGPERQGAGLRRDRAVPRRRARCSAPTPRRCRSPASPRASRARTTSSACTSSPRWTRCRCWRSSRASRPRTRRWRALDVAKQIKKTPIVVNDSRGFFTSRVIGTFINEGIAMLAEGVPAPTIEQASSQAGYPAPVLQLTRRAQPEAHAQDPRRRAGGGEARAGWDAHPSEGVIDRDARRVRPRPASSRARGFYEYEDGKRTGLWKGLRDAFPPVDDPSRSRCATSRSGCCSSRRSRRSSASTRA